MGRPKCQHCTNRDGRYRVTAGGDYSNVRTDKLICPACIHQLARCWRCHNVKDKRNSAFTCYTVGAETCFVRRCCYGVLSHCWRARQQLVSSKRLRRSDTADDTADSSKRLRFSDTAEDTADIQFQTPSKYIKQCIGGHSAGDTD